MNERGRELKSLWFLFVLFLCSSAVYASDANPSKVLKEAKRYAEEGKHEEALQKYIWYYDNALKFDKSHIGVRNSYALSYWGELSKKYPKARKAMVEIRNQKTKTLINDNWDNDEKDCNNYGAFYTFMDIRALNCQLGENEKTLKLFDLLDRKRPEIAKRCWVSASDMILNARQYDIAKKYIKDPYIDFLNNKHIFELTMHEERGFGKKFMEMEKERFRKEVINLIDFLIATEDIEKARKIQKEALSVIKDPQIENALEMAREK